MQMPKKRELVLKLAAVVHRYVLCESEEKGPCIRKEGKVTDMPLRDRVG